MSIVLKEKILPVESLILDPNNPRFAKHVDELLPVEEAEKNQEETLNKMLSKEFNFEIPELATNIMNNGYLGFDRLFVKKIKDDKYLVIEGNRRLSAVKYLLKMSNEKPRKYQINEDVRNSFKKIPCIDLSDLSDEDTKRLLGLRHYDSVKDWKPLPGSFNLFVTYMKEFSEINLGGELSLSNRDYYHDFKLDNQIIKKIAEIYSIKEASVKSMILTYRIYLQIIEKQNETDSYHETNNIFSLIGETISKPILKERFGFDEKIGEFSHDGLDLFINLCLGDGDLQPVITEVARGESTIRDYAYVLLRGDQYDKERIEINREKAENVKADLKSREVEKNLLNTLKQIKAELGNIRLDQINFNEITDGMKEIIGDLKNTLEKLTGASGGRL